MKEACASSVGSVQGRAQLSVNALIISSEWIMNTKTIRTGNILAWDTGVYYFVDTHNIKHFHEEKKQFQRQSGMWKKVVCDKP